MEVLKLRVEDASADLLFSVRRRWAGLTTDQQTATLKTAATLVRNGRKSNGWPTNRKLPFRVRAFALNVGCSPNALTRLKMLADFWQFLTLEQAAAIVAELPAATPTARAGR